MHRDLKPFLQIKVGPRPLKDKRLAAVRNGERVGFADTGRIYIQFAFARQDTQDPVIPDHGHRPLQSLIVGELFVLEEVHSQGIPGPRGFVYGFDGDIFARRHRSGGQSHLNIRRRFVYLKPYGILAPVGPVGDDSHITGLGASEEGAFVVLDELRVFRAFCDLQARENPAVLGVVRQKLESVIHGGAVVAAAQPDPFACIHHEDLERSEPVVEMDGVIADPRAGHCGRVGFQVEGQRVVVIIQKGIEKGPAFQGIPKGLCFPDLHDERFAVKTDCGGRFLHMDDNVPGEFTAGIKVQGVLSQRRHREAQEGPCAHVTGAHAAEHAGLAAGHTHDRAAFRYTVRHPEGFIKTDADLIRKVQPVSAVIRGRRKTDSMKDKQSHGCKDDEKRFFHIEPSRTLFR